MLLSSLASRLNVYEIKR